jgi:hypothetical protein
LSQALLLNQTQAPFYHWALTQKPSQLLSKPRHNISSPTETSSPHLEQSSFQEYIHTPQQFGISYQQLYHHSSHNQSQFQAHTLLSQLANSIATITGNQLSLQESTPQAFITLFSLYHKLGQAQFSSQSQLLLTYHQAKLFSFHQTHQLLLLISLTSHNGFQQVLLLQSQLKTLLPFHHGNSFQPHQQFSYHKVGHHQLLLLPHSLKTSHQHKLFSFQVISLLFNHLQLSHHQSHQLLLEQSHHQLLSHFQTANLFQSHQLLFSHQHSNHQF